MDNVYEQKENNLNLVVWNSKRLYWRHQVGDGFC